MRATGPITDVRGLGERDHVCWAYRDDAAWRERAVAWLQEGRELGLQLLLCADRDAGALRDDLAALPDRDELLEAGALVLLPLRGLYDPDAPIDAAAQQAAYEGAVAAARAAGFRGIRAVSDGTAFLVQPHLRPSVAAWELHADRWMAGGGGVSCLCTYDARAVPADAIAAVACVHPCELGAPATPFRLHAGGDGGVRLAGEVDVFDVDALAAALSGGAVDGATVDLRDLGYAHHRALQALGAAVRRSGAPVTFVGATALHRRVWELLGLPNGSTVRWA